MNKKRFKKRTASQQRVRGFDLKSKIQAKLDPKSKSSIIVYFKKMVYYTVNKNNFSNYYERYVPSKTT